ncbi:MAG: 2-(1,2-epoxy-1,2-dihydrophenyl)acetyl-CoA isomerase [Saprospiraceae bacterium]|nr:2-(1,2-epoxy-1,2-dihydrophenyl)acetyl-CoA isomerase [Saprospiraceae bacterium]
MKEVIFTREGGIAQIQINRPEKYNSVRQSVAMDIQKYLDECASDENIRVLIITGTGKAFCAGQDLGEIVDPNGPDMSIIVSQHFNPIVQKIRNLPKPVIAAVNGVAAGAGANIALACDIVVACQSASFLQAFSKIGLIPDSGGTYTLPRLIGWQRASALMMLADKISAPEALEMGMIYKVIPDKLFKDYIQKMAIKLSAMPTVALALTKEALNESLTNTFEEQLAVEDRLQNTAGRTDDYAEGVQAFLEKRKPVYKGK